MYTFNNRPCPCHVSKCLIDVNLWKLVAVFWCYFLGSKHSGVDYPWVQSRRVGKSLGDCTARKATLSPLWRNWAKKDRDFVRKVKWRFVPEFMPHCHENRCGRQFHIQPGKQVCLLMRCLVSLSSGRNMVPVQYVGALIMIWYSSSLALFYTSTCASSNCVIL